MREDDALNFGTHLPLPARESDIPKRSRIRKIVTAILRAACVFMMILLPVALTVAVGVPLAAQTEWGCHFLEHRLSQTLEAPIEIGHATWSWRKGLRLEDVRVGPVAFGHRSVEFHAEEARFRLKYRKLFSRKVQGDLSLENVEMHLRSGEEITTLPSLEWPRVGRRGFRIERLRVHGGTILLDVPGELLPLRAESVSLSGGLVIRRDRAHLILHRLEGKLSGGAVWGFGSVSMNRGRTTSSLTLNGADIEVDRSLAEILRPVAPVFELGSEESIEGLVDFELRVGESGWVSLREGRLISASFAAPSRVTLDTSFTLEAVD